MVSLHAAPTCVALNGLPAIVNVALRGVIEALGSAVSLTVPLPGPPDKTVTVIHELLLGAVQVQPVGAVTETLMDSPSTSNAFEPGEIVSVHGTPACDALKLLPAIVTVVLRGVPAVFAAALSVTVPLPDGFAGAVTVSHDAGLLAVQLQPDGAVTVTFIASPPVANAFEPGEIVSLQLMPVCVALNVRPAMVRLALRDEVPVFAAAVNLTVPLPGPLDKGVTVIHAAPFEIVQEQPSGAVTLTSTDSPPTANAFEEGEIVSLHVRPA
jgi:hypothetical protein